MAEGTSTTFYVFRRPTSAGSPYIAAGGRFYYTADRDSAAQYPTVEFALTRLAEMQKKDCNSSFVLGGDKLSLFRVTRTVTPGASRRRLLSHGESAPILRYVLANPYADQTNFYGPRDRGQWATHTLETTTHTLETTPLYNTEIAAIEEMAARQVSTYAVRRVALENTDVKVSYKEEVVA